MSPNAHGEIGRGRAATFGQDLPLPLALIAGPCQLESRAPALEIAASLDTFADLRQRCRKPHLRSAS
jgi:3-deoxy-D-manno-octulosonic acid (KDO) 8-phosphate synthase